MKDILASLSKIWHHLQRKPGNPVSYVRDRET